MAEIPSKNANCQRCGAPLAADAPEGLCPRCLMAFNLATQTDVPTGEPGLTAKGAKSENTPPLSEIAKNFPQLEILECLGRGGMGVVYKARQPRLNRLVALKILAREREQDPHFAERFEREAQALARMNHPNIVTVHDFGQAGGLYYLIMEFVDGMNLRDLLRSRKMAPEEALTVVPPICEALQYAHQQGIVHRDIKPENILLDKQGRVKIADFGIAKILGAESQQRPLTGEKQVMGTPHYMAPEQVEKPATVDHRADIYSLGVVFYEMLTGELPLGKFAPPSQKVQVDVRLDEIVLRALEKEPQRRYQQVSEVKTHLETIATSGGERAEVGVEKSEVRGQAEAIQARFSRTAITGAVWAPWFFMVAVSYFWASQPIAVPAGTQPAGPAWWQLVLMFTLLPFGLAAPFGTTILGWISVTQIRRSAGRVYGLGLAVFDGLLFPLLVLDGLLIGGLWYSVLGLLARMIGDTRDPRALDHLLLAIWIVASVSSSVFVDWLIVRRVWRAVNKPIRDGPSQPKIQPIESGKGESAYRPLPLAAWCFAVLSGILGIVAFCLLPNPPGILVWSILAAALVGVFLGFRTRNTRFGRQAIAIGGANTAIWLVVLLAVTVLPRRVSETVATGGPVREQPMETRMGSPGADLASGAKGESPEVLRKILTDFPYGIWNKPLQGYARNRRSDSWFALINFPPAEDSWVSPVARATGRATLELPADAPGEQIAAKAGSGDLYVPDLDHLVAVRGTRLAPLKYKKLPDDWAAENQATFLQALEYTTREQIAEAIKSYDAAHAEDKWVRLEEGGRYGALRPDGQLLLITAFGSGDDKSVQLIPIGKLGDAVPVRANESFSALPAFGPTIERVLNDPDDDTHNSFLDLDSGMLADCPVPWPKPGSSAEFIVGFASGMGDSYKRAVREKKLDLQGDASGHSVLALDMVTAAVANDLFDSLTASEIATNSALSGAPQEGAVLNATNVPATWLFKTREGGKGVLQIVSFNDKEPRSAKIRYKLVQSEKGGGASLSPSDTPKASGATQRHLAKEDTYTITSVIQVLKPADPEDMKDDFQDVRVLAQDKDSYTLEVTYYPLFQPVIAENPDWRKQESEMTQYLKPMPAANWDEAMQRDLIADLKKAGIEPEHLTDRQLVERVARWALDRAHETDAFSIWCVDFQGGKPRVFPPLRDAFEHEKHDKTRTDDQMFEQEVLGRSMFYNRVHGSCTSYSVYLATILRALGIPTRIVFCIPPFDPNDETQAQMFYGAIHHNEVRETVRAALDGTSGFENHLFNEVYVGGHWERLNYARLGQPILDRHYFGLLTHIYSCSDLSDVPLAQTWGMRYFHYPADQPKFSSVNPYRLISVMDHFGTNAHLGNPLVEPVELQKVTIIGLYGKDAPEIPEDFKKSWNEMAPRPDAPDFLIAIKEWLPNAPNQMRALQGRIGRKFVLKAPGHPQICALLTQLDMSSGGSFQAFGAQIDAEDKPKLVPGAAYSIEPINISDTYRWLVASNVALVLPSPTNPAVGAGAIGAGPLIARDVTLNFAGPTLSDESFHTKRPTAFDFDLHDPSNQGGFAVTTMLIGQTEFMVSVMKSPVGTRVEINDLNKKVFLDEVWNNRTNHFERLVRLPVDYNQKHYSCPVRIKFGREKRGPLWGEYSFCAYLSGRVNLGGSEKKFELVSSDPRILFRGTNDGKPFQSLGIDLNNDGRIDAGPDGGESFNFDETFALGAKHYRLSEADASSLRVAFQEVTEPDYVKALEILKQTYGVWAALQHTIEKKDDLKLAQSLASQSLDQLRAYDQLVRGTPVEFSQTNILDDVVKIMDALKAGNWDQVEALENADSGGTDQALDTEKLDELAAIQSARAFGPVVERTLPLKWKTGTAYCLDFESGKLVAPPGRLTSVDLGWDQWCAQSGVDAMAEEPRSGSVIWGQRCVFSKVDAGRWETIKPERVVKELLEGRNTTMQAEVPNRQAVPAMFLFKTREESRGVLQIIGFSENPRGVKIRYKLVEKTAARAAP